MEDDVQDMQEGTTRPPEPIGDATYSPEDNKLRLYPYDRLTGEVWAELKGKGFKWAPYQKLFVAPKWTPGRHDALMRLCGEIGDELTSAEERAAQRAERFERYKANRHRDAMQEAATVQRLESEHGDVIAHNDARKAERIARKVKRAMERAVDQWGRHEYWTSRIPAVLAHADYKDRIEVRHRRIKGLESDRRRLEKSVSEHAKLAERWSAEDLDSRRAWQLANYDRSGAYDVLRKGTPADPADANNDGWGGVQFLTPVDAATIEAARDRALRYHDANEAWAARWLAHTNLRLSYERDVIEAQGGSPATKHDYQPGGTVTVVYRFGHGLAEQCTVLKVNKGAGGEVNSLTIETPPSARRFRGSQMVLKVEDVRGYEAPKGDTPPPKAVRRKVLPLCNYPSPDAVSMTEAEYKAIPRREIRKYYNPEEPQWKQKPTHRRYHAWIEDANSAWGGRSTYVHLSDKNTKLPPDQKPEPPKPEPPRPDPEPIEESGPELTMQEAMGETPQERTQEPAQPTLFDTFAEKLKGGGIQVVVSDQLYPTPRDIAQRAVDLAGIEPGDRVLEPSAGTGNLLGAMGGRMFTAEGSGAVVAVELVPKLCEKLRADYPLTTVLDADYLSTTAADLGGAFDAVVMNPPFSKAADIKHIEHALTMLKDGGRLVAICANGPRQRAAFMDRAEHWEDLPEGTFKAAGTNVRTALFVMRK